MRPDGSRVDLALSRARPGGCRFLPDGRALVCIPSQVSQNFVLLDLKTLNSRPLASLGDRGALTSFDITPDGKFIVFDRSRENSNIVLFELPGK